MHNAFTAQVRWETSADALLAVKLMNLLWNSARAHTVFIASVLISLHCGLGGDMNIMWYHRNLLGSDTCLWFWIISIDLTPGSSCNDSFSLCCLLKKPFSQDACIFCNCYSLHAIISLRSVLYRCTYMRKCMHRILHEIT